MTASYYFDETIFTTSESFIPFHQINVYNRADEYLVERAQLNVVKDYDCQMVQPSSRVVLKTLNTTTINDDIKNELTKVVANLNPRRPCRGINIYSFNLTNNRIEKTTNFHQIGISDNSRGTPIFIGEHIANSIYTVGDLTSFESAIMIKYFAINHDGVYVTRHLYNEIIDFFDQQRDWFNYKSIGVVQKLNKELILDNKILNVPDVTISSDFMPLY